MKRLSLLADQLWWQIRTLFAPVLFDADAYISAYLSKGFPTALAWPHFLLVGSFRKYNPHPTFHSAFYENALGRKVRLPYWHYRLVGYRQGISPCPLFHPAYFLRQVPRGEETRGISTLEVYLARGRRFHAKPSEMFDSENYYEWNADVRASGQEALTHFLRFGIFEGRRWSDITGLPGKYAGNFEAQAAQAALLAPVSYRVPARGCVLPVKLVNVRDLPGAEIIYQGEAPTLTVEPPTMVGDTTVVAPRAEVSGLAPYVAKLHDVFIVGGTRLVFRPGQWAAHDEVASDVAREFSPKTPFLKIATNGDGHVLRTTAKRAARIPSGVLITSEYDQNYYHWLLESLPKVLLSEKAAIPDDVPFLIPENLVGNLRRAFEIVNQQRRPVVKLESGVAYEVDKLYYPSDLSRLVDRYSGSPQATDCILSPTGITEMFARLKSALLPENAPVPRGRRIYLSRSTAPYRKPSNEKEIELLLFSRGFEIVDLNGYSLELQARLMNEAVEVVAPSGAACTNMGFCRPGTRFVILALDHPSSNPQIFAQLGSILGLPTTYVFGSMMGKIVPKYAVHDDFALPEQLLLQALNA